MHHQTGEQTTLFIMKNLVLGSLIGLAIVFAFDTLIRIIISLSIDTDIRVFEYEAYRGMFWKLIIASSTLITTFAGAFYALNNAKDRQLTVVLLFGALIVALRYGQIHYIVGTAESLFFPISALVFSLLGIVGAWKLTHRKPAPTKEKEPRHHQPKA